MTNIPASIERRFTELPTLTVCNSLAALSNFQNDRKRMKYFHDLLITSGFHRQCMMHAWMTPKKLIYFQCKITIKNNLSGIWKRICTNEVVKSKCQN